MLSYGVVKIIDRAGGGEILADKTLKMESNNIQRVEHNAILQLVQFQCELVQQDP